MKIEVFYTFVIMTVNTIADTIPELENIIVSGSRSEMQAEKIPVPVHTVKNSEIIDNMNSNVVDAIASTPGFAQIWEYHSPLLLRGMNSNRLVVLKNGNRRIGTFPGGYFAQDIDIYNTDRIEILKGPASVFYGSGAISGIINIVPKSLFGHATETQILGGYGSNNHELLNSINFSHNRERFGTVIHSRWRKTKDYHYGDDSGAENSNVEDRDISFSLGARPYENGELCGGYEYHFGDWGKPRGFNGLANDFTVVRNKEKSHSLFLNYIHRPAMQGVDAIHLNIFIDDGTRDYSKCIMNQITNEKSSQDLIHFKSRYGGGQLYAECSLFRNHFVTGFDGYLFRLDSPGEFFDYYNMSHGSIPGYTGAGQQSLGVFLSHTFEVNEKVNLLSGIRVDGAKVVEGESLSGMECSEFRKAFSGNAGAVYTPVKGHYLSINIGRAFRMPIAEELFTEIVSCKGIKKGNPELDPEYSWNFDLGYRGFTEDKKRRWDIAGFYNSVSEFISEAAETERENVDFTYCNLDATVLGCEASISRIFGNIAPYSNKLILEAAFSYVYGIDHSDKDSDVPLFGIPPFKVLGNVKYETSFLPQCFVFIKAESELSGAQNRVGKIPEGTDGGPWGYTTSESAILFNLSAGVFVKGIISKPNIRIIIKNLADSRHKPFGSYIPVMGRNVKIVSTFRFN